MSGECNSLTRDGIAYIQWVNTIFGSCIQGNQEAISIMLGYLSIACWLNAQAPQVITNYKNKSADGLSLPFLINWLLGDITNFVGGILTHQLKFQIYLAGYFCVVDFILFFQYFYYTWYQDVSDGEDIPVRPLSTQSLKDSILEGARRSYTFPARKNQSHKRLSSMVFAVLLFTFHSTSSISSSTSTSTTHDDETSFNPEAIGRVLAWTGTVLYLTSRMPQIWKNYTRRSVEGLSIFMFIFAAFGNLTYASSIFTDPSLGTDPTFLRKEIPYILGSIGTLIFDITIFIQWYILRDPEHKLRRRRSSRLSRRSSRRSISYNNDSIGYHQLPTDEESYNRRRGSLRNGQIEGV